MSLLPVLQSTFSSSWLCWFTTVTCTQDILSRTAAALAHLAAHRLSAPSGYGCRTTLYEKPACTRYCLPTLTCSSTRESEDRTLFCALRSNQKLLTDVLLSQLYVPVKTSLQLFDFLTMRPERKAILQSL